MKYTAIKDIIFLMFSSFILKSYNTQSQRNAQKLDEPSALEKILHKTVRLDIDVIWFVKKKPKQKHSTMRNPMRLKPICMKKNSLVFNSEVLFTTLNEKHFFFQ